MIAGRLISWAETIAVVYAIVRPKQLQPILGSTIRESTRCGWHPRWLPAGNSGSW